MFKTKLTFERETKNTFVYVAVGGQGAVKSLYTNKADIQGAAPATITLEAKESK